MKIVYNVLYGCVDFADRQVLDTFNEEEDAFRYAEECAQDQFDDQPTLTNIGWTYEVQSDRVVLFNEDHQEVEWWIIEPSTLQ